MNALLELPPTSTDPLEGVFRLSVQQYLEMGKHGILTPEHRVELIDGILRKKPMQNWLHIWCVRQLVELLLGCLSKDAWDYLSQATVHLNADSHPEPDICILRGSRGVYRQRQITAADIALMIEVANTSLPFDSTVKRLLYARNGIPQYWVVNTNDSVIDVYTNPNDAGDYQSLTSYPRGQQIPLELDGHIIAHLNVYDIIPEETA